MKVQTVMFFVCFFTNKLFTMTTSLIPNCRCHPYKSTPFICACVIEGGKFRQALSSCYGLSSAHRFLMEGLDVPQNQEGLMWLGRIESPSLLSSSEGSDDEGSEKEISVIPRTPECSRPKTTTHSLPGRNLLSSFTTPNLSNRYRNLAMFVPHINQ